MLIGDERDGVGDADLPDDQDFELVECVYAVEGNRTMCIPFDNIIKMSYECGKIELLLPNDDQHVLSNSQCNINDIWQSWLVYCGAKSRPFAEF